MIVRCRLTVKDVLAKAIALVASSSNVERSPAFLAGRPPSTNSSGRSGLSRFLAATRIPNLKGRVGSRNCAGFHCRLTNAFFAVALPTAQAMRVKIAFAAVMKLHFVHWRQGNA